MPHNMVIKILCQKLPRAVPTVLLPFDWIRGTTLAVTCNTQIATVLTAPATAVSGPCIAVCNVPPDLRPEVVEQLRRVHAVALHPRGNLQTPAPV